MSSLFKLNQLTEQQEVTIPKEGQKSALENRDREIYALRQQLQTLKLLYKNAKSEAIPQKNTSKLYSESDYSKQRVEKLMAVLAEREKQMRMQQQEANLQHSLVMKECLKERQAKQISIDEITALHGQVAFLKTKLIGSQNVFKVQQQQIEDQAQLEERRRDHFQDMLKESESLANSWEQKYAEVNAKWQEHDQQLKEYKNLEEKLSQIKSTWVSFDKFFGEDPQALPNLEALD